MVGTGSYLRLIFPGSIREFVIKFFESHAPSSELSQRLSILSKVNEIPMITFELYSSTLKNALEMLQRYENGQEF